MARVEIPIVVVKPQVNPGDPLVAVNGASISVLNRADSTTATVFTAETGGTTASQPLSTDSNGRVSGWLARGRYDVRITIPGQATYSEFMDAATGEDGSITTAWLSDGSVTTAKIADVNVTTGKIADGAVTPVKQSGALYPRS